MTSPDGCRTTFVVVTYNSMSTLPETLAAAKRCYEAGLARCVVADNTSKDGSPEYVDKDHPWVTLIRTGGNLGFGRGNNRGFEAVETEFTFFLNPDAACEPDALRTLVRFMDEHPRAGVAGPAAHMEDGALHAAGQLPTPQQIVREVMFLGSAAQHRQTVTPGAPARRVEWVSGAALFFRSELFRALGGFDPRFFLYFEETDLLLRVREHGAEVWAVGEAVIEHLGGTATRAERANMYLGCISEHYFQSRFYYLVKHFGRPAAYLAEGAELAVMAARAVPQAALRRPRIALRQRLGGPVFELPPERR